MLKYVVAQDFEEGVKAYIVIIASYIFMFRLYTNVRLLEYLLDNEITVAGTVNSNKKGIPEEMKKVEGRPVGDYKILYQEDGKTSLHSWIVKSKKGK